MVAAVAIENIERVDTVEMVLLQIGCEHAGDAGVKARTQQGCKARILETVLIGPLPMIFELCDIKWLVVRGVHVMHASGKAGVHDVEVLVWKRQVYDEAWFNLIEQSGRRSDVVGIKAISVNINTGPFFNRSSDRIAFRFRTARQTDVAKDIRVHGHLVDSNRSDAACANYQYLAHLQFPLIRDSLSARI